MPADPRVLGANVVLTTNNMPLSTALALNVVGINPSGGVELLPGAPGCFSYLNFVGGELVYMLTVLPSDVVNLTIPNDPFFLGVEYYTQTVCFAPGVNPFSLVTSNAVKGTINSV
jgi:hypothetical protein